MRDERVEDGHIRTVPTGSRRGRPSAFRWQGRTGQDEGDGRQCEWGVRCTVRTWGWGWCLVVEAGGGEGSKSW